MEEELVRLSKAEAISVMVIQQGIANIPGLVCAAILHYLTGAFDRWWVILVVYAAYTAGAVGVAWRWYMEEVNR